MLWPGRGCDAVGVTAGKYQTHLCLLMCHPHLLFVADLHVSRILFFQADSFFRLSNSLLIVLSGKWSLSLALPVWGQMLPQFWLFRLLFLSSY